MKRNLLNWSLALGIVLLQSCGGNTPPEQVEEEAPLTEEQLIEKARGIHERVITLDTHNDIDTKNFTAEQNYTTDLGNQVNLPKMNEGGLDVSWMIVYTGQGELTKEGYKKAYDNAIDKFEAIHRLCEEIAPDQIELALTSDDVRRISASGKKVAMIGIENAYPIGTDLSNIQKFADMGGRYMSLAHNGHSQLSDSNTGERDSVWLHNGLSELGKQAIAEMNKWGIMIDVSHPSKEAMKQMIELTKAPIIASHSSARAVCDVSRNLDDEQLQWMKDNGGVVQAVALGDYVNAEKSKAYSEKRQEVFKQVAEDLGYVIPSRGEIRNMKPDEQEKVWAMYQEVQQKAGAQMDSLTGDIARPNVSDFVDHIDYMVQKIGVDHVGISSDFDGGGGIDGWDDASETFNVTLELVRRGYSEDDIAKLWSGNLLRVLDEVQKISAEMR